MPTEGKLITDIQRAWNGLLGSEKTFEVGATFIFIIELPLKLKNLYVLQFFPKDCWKIGGKIPGD